MKQRRSFPDPLDQRCDLFDELIAQSWTSFVVPESGCAKLRAGLKMEFDTHDDVRAPSGFPLVQTSNEST
jgi:hypothetical protein